MNEIHAKTPANFLRTLASQIDRGEPVNYFLISDGPDGTMAVSYQHDDNPVKLLGMVRYGEESIISEIAQHGTRQP